jgi:PKD repeat protein
MKRIALLLCSFLISYASLSAQTNWSTPISLGSGIFYSMEAKGNSVHMAYGDGTIRYRRSTDEGSTWSAPFTIGSGTIYLDRPICVDGNNVYLVYFRDFITVTDWCCPRNLGNLYMRKSTDGGATWQPEVQLTTARGAYRVAMITEGQNVYLSWMDYRSGTTWDLYFRKSSDGGQTWQNEVKLVNGNNSVGAERPDIVVLGNSVHLFWMSAFDNLPPCYTMPNCSEVFYKRSLDGGQTWGPDTRLNLTNNYAARPISTVIPPGTVITSWEGEDGTGQNEPYVLRSIDNGSTWETVQRMRDLPGEASHQNVASGGNNVHLAWHDGRETGNRNIYYRQSNDQGATWGPEEAVSNALGDSEVPVLGTTTHYVHVVWADDRSGSFQPLYSRRLVGPTAGFSSTPATGCAPTTVQYTNTSTGDPTSFKWYFPGGTPDSSDLENPSITYSTPGTYPAFLTVKNAAGGDTKTVLSAVTVLPTPVLSNIEPEYTGYCPYIPAEVYFNVVPVGSLVSWTNSNPATGLAASGVGDISFLTNNVDTIQTSVISAHATLSGCNSPEQSFTITIYPEAVAEFSSMTNGTTVSFFNNSSYADVFVWYFDDGDTSTLPNPVHTYSNNGTYNVMLAVSGYCAGDYVIHPVTVSTVDTQTPDWIESFNLFPNPNNGLFNLEMRGLAQDKLEFTLLNAEGQSVSRETLDFHTGALARTFDYRHLPAGVYKLNIGTDKGAFFAKVIVKQ